MKKMKKIITIIMLVIAMISISSIAFAFPQPDWGALLSERRNMVTTSDFELYVEGQPGNAPYYGAKFEPRSGVYLGMATNGIDGSLYNPVSSYLTYIDNFQQHDLYYDTAALVRENDAVTMVGWTVNSLDDVNYDDVRITFEKINSYGKPMFIRFANEMNVSQLGDDPARYVQIFRNVANIAHEYPNLAVVWSPCDLGALDRPFDYYYPGDEYVDWIGVSCYMPKYFNNDPPTTETNATYFMTGDYAWATNKLKPIMKFMSDNNINKPVMISEGGVARYSSFGDDYTGWHEPRLRNMLWNVIMKYPQIKMINYFNVNFGNFGEQYYLSDYPESVNIFNEANKSGAYLQSANGAPEFVFSRANDGGTLIADNSGIIRLYTLAYFVKQPNISVNYRIDGQWFHSANQIPYICNLDINNISDGVHKLSIDANGTSKDYTLYKRGIYISFGKEPDISLPAPELQTQEKEIAVILNGQKLSFDTAPIMMNGRTLVPIRTIFEAMGYTVSWSDISQSATAEKGNDRITVRLNDDTINYLTNGSLGTYKCDVPPQLISDRILVPARAVAESAGCLVDWDDSTQTVIIQK